MKHLYKLLALFAVLLIAVNCDKNEDFKFTTPSTSFEITSPSDGASLILDHASNTQNEALTVVWTDNVTEGNNYTITMATDQMFTQAIPLGMSSTNSFSMTVEAFNDFLYANDIPAITATTIYLKVTADSFESNAISLTVSPFPTENPIITAPDNNFEVVLSDITADDTAVTIAWNDPNFEANSAVNVNYYIEAAEANTNFSSVEALGNVQDNTLALTHAQLNTNILNMGFNAGDANMIDIRVRAVLETGSGEIVRTSDAITLTVTAYETALPTTLYGVGAGLPDAGWGWNSPVELVLQGAVYSGNVNLSPDNGGNFRFFTVLNDWGSGQNYPWYTDRGYTIHSDLVNAMDGDNNFQFVGTAGEYFLEIDTENKTINLSPPQVGPNCEFDQLWLVGAGVPDAGWGWNTPVALPCTGNGVYSGNVNLQSDANSNNFRFFTANGDWGSGRNFPYYADQGYTIDANLVNAMDGDSNFAFTGTNGTYFMEVDTVNQTISLGAPQTNCEFDQLWLVGAGVPDAGWGWNTPVELPCVGNGIYSGTVTFALDSFRFFTANGDWGSGRNFPYYINEGYTIDANFEDAMDGDNNFRFIGTPGSYTLTLDTVNNTISIN